MHSTTVSGRVSDSRGRPLGDTRVSFESGPVPLPDIAALTNDRGEFSLSVPVAGVYQIGCVAEGFARATVSVNVPPGQDVRQEIRLKR